MGTLQARILEWVAMPSKGSSHPGIQPRSLILQADSLPSEPRGKPMNTGVGSLSLLQGIFPTQESNQGLLHCRQILYQLSYQGNPYFLWSLTNYMFQTLFKIFCGLHLEVGFLRESWLKKVDNQKRIFRSTFSLESLRNQTKVSSGAVSL